MFSSGRERSLRVCGLLLADAGGARCPPYAVAGWVLLRRLPEREGAAEF